MSGWLPLIVGVLLLVMSAADLAWGQSPSLLRLVLGLALVGIGAVQLLRRQHGR
ncbi:MAG: hypothetical protein AB1449_07900 [Chloroflexota bacterium]